MRRLLPVVCAAMALAGEARIATAQARPGRQRTLAEDLQLFSQVLNQIRVKDPEHYKRYYEGAMQAMQAYQRRHYCANRGEWRSDVYGFAVPLSQPVDSNLFVFNCGIPAVNGSYTAIEREVAPRLVSLVRSIEVMLGLT